MSFKKTNLPKNNNIAWANKMQDGGVYVKCEILKTQLFGLTWHDNAAMSFLQWLRETSTQLWRWVNVRYELAM